MPDYGYNYFTNPDALNWADAPLTLGGNLQIPVFESVKGVTESISITDGPGLQRTYLCPGTRRLDLAAWMTGYSTATGGRNGTITRVPPYRHPEAPGVYATAMTIENLGEPYAGPTGVAYPVAKLNVQFGTLPYQPFPDLNQNNTLDDSSGSWVYCKQSVEVGEESLEIPASAWQYDTATQGNIPATKSRTVATPTIIVRATFFQLPTFPDQIWNYYNNSNKDIFLGFTQGKVKFAGATIDIDSQSNGTESQQATCTYKIRPIKDWNYEINPDGTSGNLWIRSSYRNGDVLFFPYADLTQTVPNPNYLGGNGGSSTGGSTGGTS